MKVPFTDEDLAFIQKYNIKTLNQKSPFYPKQLFDLIDPPPIIYVQGDEKILSEPQLAIIGTRRHSIYGGETAYSFAKSLAVNFHIISGLANGIDTKAHFGALTSGKTIAVLGSGLAEIYPKENLRLAEQIIETGGAIISEFPLKAAPLRFHFPKRNRIVAALSQGILLVESPIKGGGMITMEKGYELKRKLFTIPGRIDMETFQGNLQLIKNGRATLVQSPEDIAHFYGKSEIINCPKLDKNNLNDDEKLILKLLSQEEKSIDELVLLTQYPVMKLNILLTSLSLKKFIKEFPGKIYRRKIDG